jgi:uncharacterized protein YgiB involved in biofilm formation
MRRSAAIRLTLLAPFAAVAGCDDPPRDPALFRDAAACAAHFGAGSQQMCEEAQEAARTEHARTAPRFTSLEECRAATGGEPCEATPASSTSGTGVRPVFIPLMWGYALGPRGAGLRPDVAPVYRGPAAPGASGATFYSGGRAFARADVAPAAGARSVTLGPGTGTVMRGGFGASAVSSSAS